MHIININDKRFVVQYVIKNNSYTEEEITNMRKKRRCTTAIIHNDELIFANEIEEATLVIENLLENGEKSEIQNQS